MEAKDKDQAENLIAALQQENRELKATLQEQAQELEKLRAVATALQNHFLKNGPAWQVERCAACGKCDYMLLEESLVNANILSK